jgi:endonuclease/exonuclease/phosphatase family metal-dependent hydrolase
MTFNIRYDTSADSLNAWSNRKEFAASCIDFYEADIVGLQEVLHHQLDDLKHYLPAYESLGVGRYDGKTKGEYSAIMYRKDRFEVLETETFWLSENPQAVGVKGWDAACERIVTWGHFKEKQTGKDFYFVNTHFDHIGKVARRESSKLLLSKIKEIAKDKPVIVTGDFNAGSTDEAVKILTDESDPNHLLNTYNLSPLKYGPDWSFHAFGRIPVSKRIIIDYIFVKGNIATDRHGILYDTKNEELYLSDHNPVLCTVTLRL